MTMRVVIGINALLIGLYVAATAEPSVVVIPPQIEGNSSEALVGLVVEKSESALQISSLQVIPSARYDKAVAQTPLLRDCYTKQCLQTLREKLGSPESLAIVKPKLRIAEGSYRFTIEVLDSTTPEGITAHSDECNLCTTAEFGDSVARATAKAMEAFTSRPLPVYMASKPGKALVTVGTRRPKETPSEMLLPPGPHVVSVSKKGYLTLEQTITVEGQKLGQQFMFELQRDGDSVSRPYRTWKWVAVGGAVASFAAGGYLLSIDGDPVDCMDPLTMTCPTVYKNKGIGYTLLGVGAVSTGAAVTFFILDGKQQTEVTPTPGGIAVVHTVRF